MTQSIIFSATASIRGVELTIELAGMLNLTSSSIVLDVASGKGTSGFVVAEAFDCRVIGIDQTEANVADAKAEAVERGLSDRIQFILADAEELRFVP
ncbi:MAG TPA: class I SAM-dependent methyltransferase [Acidobacteriaceae bacterium]